MGKPGFPPLLFTGVPAAPKSGWEKGNPGFPTPLERPCTPHVAPARSYTPRAATSASIAACSSAVTFLPPIPRKPPSLTASAAA